MLARAQQPLVKVIGYLFTDEAPTEGNIRNFDNINTFREAIAKLGWIEGLNLRIEVRAGASDLNRIRAAAAELVALAPDVIVTQTFTSTRAMQQQTQNIPIIFTGVGGDPVATGFVSNIARPEGNTTGFTNLFFSISGKWVELLKNAAPHITKVALLFNPATSPRPIAYIRAAQTAATKWVVQSIEMPVRNDLELERAISAFGAEQDGRPNSAATGDWY